MLALLSSPVRRWLLISLAVPAIAFVLRTLGRFLQKRNGGEPTKLSRALLSGSALLRRRVGKQPEAESTAAGLSRG